MELPPFIEIAECTVSLGWRFDNVVPQDAKTAIEAHLDGYDYRLNLFSPLRTVTLNPYSLTSEPVPWAQLIADSEAIEESNSLHEICTRLNEQLNANGLRLPTEDELEAAAGGNLFSWGDTIPEGIPYRDRTQFTGHKNPTASGIRFNSDTYATELVDGYLKFGDGGVTVCGGEPWPMAWLCLSPAFRVPADMYADCLFEYLETMVIHPAKVG